jgi:hypothetical protein
MAIQSHFCSYDLVIEYGKLILVDELLDRARGFRSVDQFEFYQNQLKKGQHWYASYLEADTMTFIDTIKAFFILLSSSYFLSSPLIILYMRINP